jgi:hypothetical protein
VGKTLVPGENGSPETSLGGILPDMSRFAEVIVLARNAEAVMEPLTRPEPDREWFQCFTPVDDGVFYGTGSGSREYYMWVIQFWRHNWRNLLSHLESLS